MGCFSLSDLEAISTDVIKPRFTVHSIVDPYRLAHLKKEMYAFIER